MQGEDRVPGRSKAYANAESAKSCTCFQMVKSLSSGRTAGSQTRSGTEGPLAHTEEWKSVISHLNLCNHGTWGLMHSFQGLFGSGWWKRRRMKSSGFGKRWGGYVELRVLLVAPVDR